MLKHALLATFRFVAVCIFLAAVFVGPIILWIVGYALLGGDDDSTPTKTVDYPEQCWDGLGGQPYPC